MHFTVLRQALKRGKISPRFAKSGNPREIYFSPRFLDFRRRRGDTFYSFEASSQKGLNIAPLREIGKSQGNLIFSKISGFPPQAGRYLPKKLISHVTKESLFFLKEGVSGTFLRKKFVMSLFRIIFAFRNGQETASHGYAPKVETKRMDEPRN